MTPTVEEKTYDYLGVQALPPRKKGRDRRRLNKAMDIPEEEESNMVKNEVLDESVVDDPFSPYVEEYCILSFLKYRLAHVRVPDGLSYSEERELKYEFLDNTADIQVHSCILFVFVFYCVGGDTIQEAIEQCVLGMFGYIV